jgi:PAS domain S-box-containing protein
MTIADLLEEADRPAAMADFASLTATGRLDRDMKLVRPDGRRVWVTLRGVKLTANRIMAFCHDITKRKEMEAALHEAQSILQGAMDQSQAGIAIADAPTGQLRYVNDAGLFIRGEDREALVHGIGIDQYVASWQLFDFDGTPLPANAVPLARAIQHGETSSREFIIRRSATDDRVVLAKAAPITDARGKVTAAVVVFVDITDRKLAEEALRTSEEHFRQLVQALPIPVGYVNSRGDVVTTNARITQVLGYTPEDIPTADEWFRRAFPDDDYRQRVLQRWAEDLREALDKGREVPPAEYSVTCKNGDIRTMSIAGVPVGDDLLVTMLDVTEKRALEERLALTARLAALGTLVAGVAHEINNPLSSVISGQGSAREVIEAAKELAGNGASPDQAALTKLLKEGLDALNDAQEGGLRIASIVKDLTAFGRPSPTFARARMIDIVGSAMHWLPATVAHRGQIRVEDLGAPDVLASKGQIEQVLVNLVTNAANAIPQGKRGVIAIRVGPGDRDMARLEVIDDGAGMSPATIHRVFEPFFTTRPVGKGTGLGLAICHAIVMAHGGTLDVESEVGKGSTFRVELPAAPAEA